jgi:phage gp36-like protein
MIELIKYCSLTDLLKKETKQVLVDLTNDESGVEIVQSVVEDSIRRATDVVNSFIRGRFPVPIADSAENVPDSIRGVCVDIAIFFLYQRQMRTQVPDSIKDLYKNAKSELVEYQTGKRSIDNRDSGNEMTTPVKWRTKTRQFTDSQTLTGF